MLDLNGDEQFRNAVREKSHLTMKKIAVGSEKT